VAADRASGNSPLSCATTTVGRSIYFNFEEEPSRRSAAKLLPAKPIRSQCAEGAAQTLIFVSAARPRYYQHLKISDRWPFEEPYRAAFAVCQKLGQDSPLGPI